MSLVARPVQQIGRGSDTGVSDTYVDTGVNYDIAIGGLPFKLATSEKNPSIRRTAQYRKQQVDQSPEPGEQSIVQWWMKSQSTFHLGAGQKYIDSPSPGNENIAPLRYQNSTGINPWKIGQAGLLNQTSAAADMPTIKYLTADTDGSATRMMLAGGTGCVRISETVTGGNPTYTLDVVSWGGFANILGLATDGSSYYVADNTGIFKGTLTGATPGAGTLIYNLPSGTSSVVLGWVKARLVALVNVGGATPSAKVYQLQSNPGSPTLPAESYSHSNPNHVWTALAEGPSAIYAAGYAGNHSEILAFTLDTQGDMPTLTGGIGVATFQPGERVLGMSGYLSTALGVSTTRGFHVGLFGQQGEVQMGPLSIDNTNLSGGVAGSDRFFYCAGTHDDGTAGMYRIDTSQQLSIKQFSYTPDQRFGWATDVRAAQPDESVVPGQAGATAITRDGRVAFAVPGFGLYVQHPSKLVPSGTLTTSRIRFNTLDPKVYRFVRIRGDASTTAFDSGAIAVSTSLTDAAGQVAGILNVGTSGDSGDLATNQPPAVYATVTFTLSRAADTINGPWLTGYQLKALPAQRRQRELLLPIQVFDNVLDNTGAQIGGDGNALSRLLALEAMEQKGDIVTLQYLGAYPDQGLTEFVIIDQIEFTQTVDPPPRQGWGGTAVVTCRTIS